MKYKKYFVIFNLDQFDPVTKFRLQNAFAVGIGLALIAPIMIALKGALLPIWAIATFAIIATVSVKTNSYFSSFRLDQLYHWGIYVHLVLVFIALSYFIDPTLMVILESLLVIMEMTIFSAYSIVLTEYLTDYYPDSMKKFQIVKNNSWADASLIGLTIVTIITYFFSTGLAIGIFIIYNSAFAGWMIKNWDFYTNPELKGYLTNAEIREKGNKCKICTK